MVQGYEALNNGGYTTKDSGKREEFSTGAVRDTQDQKERYDLLPVLCLKRVAQLYQRGAEKYSSRNWQKGIPISRFYASGFRHLMQWAEGDRTEDHLAAVVFNVFGIMWTEVMIDLGKLPKELKDMNE